MKKNMTIDIICPLYDAENYIENLNKSIIKQKKVEINSIKYVLTKGKDNTESLLKKLKCEYTIISPSEFSHSYTREMMAKKCTGDIIVFISQDIKILRNDWLYYLTKDIVEGNCEAAY